MPLVVDISHYWGSDVGTSPTGDLQAIAYKDRTIQRIIRRLLTPQTTTSDSSYPFEPNYGAGIGLMIGGKIRIGAIRSLILSQMLKEPSIARTPLPQVSVVPLNGNGASVSIQFIDDEGTFQSDQFNISNG